LLQQPLRRRDLVTLVALRIIGVFHAGGFTAASGEQREKKGDNPVSGHPRHIGSTPFR
jgi:hypothetical protein